MARVGDATKHGDYRCASCSSYGAAALFILSTLLFLTAFIWIAVSLTLIKVILR